MKAESLSRDKDKSWRLGQGQITQLLWYKLPAKLQEIILGALSHGVRAANEDTADASAQLSAKSAKANILKL